MSENIVTTGMAISQNIEEKGSIKIILRCHSSVGKNPEYLKVA